MQLWKKNFYFTFVIIHLVVLSSIFFFIRSNFKQRLQTEIKVFEQLTMTSDILINQFFNETGRFNSRGLAMGLEEFEFYFDVYEEGTALSNDIPESLKQPLIGVTNDIQLNKMSGKPILYQQSFSTVKGVERQVVYVRDISHFYREHLQKTWLMYGLGLFVTALIMVVTYWQMKRIYRPIQNLAHELRTPLTVISGYSELLMRIKTSEEEKVTMSMEILREVANLQEVVEQLLLMGDLKDGEISQEKLFLSELINEYQDKYPKLIVKTHDEKSLQGNRVLLLRLLDNLLTNAYRASEQVFVTITQKQLVMMNQGPTIRPVTLKRLNKGRELAPNEYSGMGQGLIICREIVQLHQGTMHLTSEDGCTRVKLNF